VRETMVQEVGRPRRGTARPRGARLATGLATASGGTRKHATQCPCQTPGRLKGSLDQSTGECDGKGAAMAGAYAPAVGGNPPPLAWRARVTRIVPERLCFREAPC
jgi:hypothetical protein